MTKELTVPEMRQKFLESVWDMVNFWSGNEIQTSDLKDRLAGLAFSILSTIDGSSAALPAFEIIPHPHEDDESYAQTRNEDWWVPEDLGGYLHEEFYKYKR